jgi:crotonobetainyl-CoA:carnitine CoA-transferase CaiB-like acyl-CoA transferase
MNCLDRIKVIDMTQFLSASYCTQILGDLGADVIKIERPGQGEVYRTYGPKFINGESTSFLALNRNKRSLTLDIKKPEAKKILYRLAETADILVENFRPGTLKKYGFDYESLKRVNPRLIYCSVSGFGQTGPYASKGGFDLTAQAMSGLMYVTGEKNGPPVKVGYPITDIGGGMYAALGILAALMAREKTGKGQLVDTSLFEAGVAWGMMAGLNYFADGSIQGRMGSASPQNAPYQAFTVKDGAFTMGTGNDVLWEKFCDVFNMTYLLQDERYKDNASRVENQASLAAEIEKVLKNYTVEECLEKLDSVGIPCGPINSIDKVMNDSQVKARGIIWDIEHPVAGKIPNIGFPVIFSDTPCMKRSYPPQLGEHSREILREIKFSEEEINTFIAAGVTSVLKE